jgi:DNA repair exonuclease SbcCD nuclease subunit
MKVVHAADLHLDSPLTGLTPYEGAPLDEVRSATRRALAALVDLCVDEAAARLLIAGDLYDGDFRDYATALSFAEQMARLSDCGTQVVWLRGNHDAANRITKHLRTAEHVTELSPSHPDTVVFEPLGLAVHGQGYARRDVTENLVQRYPNPRSDLLNVGLLHTALDGREGHAPYAPCTLSDLTARGYDYWALGHVHTREVLATDPYIVFAGNLQGRHARETGPKGATVVEIDTGRITSVTPRVLDVVRWETATVDATDRSHLLDVVDAAANRIDDLTQNADGRLLATRVVVVGRTAAHGALAARQHQLENELRAYAIERGDVYIERVIVKTTGHVTAEALAERRDAVADLFRSVAEAREDSEVLAALRREVLTPLTGVAAELLREEELDFREVLADAEQLLAGRLLEGGEEKA